MRRLNLGSIGPSGAGRSLATDADAIAAAMASLARVPVQRVTPRKHANLEQQANRLLGEKPITSDTPLIRREKRRR
jgi:hypothetical protein